MIIQPKYRGFICTTAHPEGCRQSIINQIDFAKMNKNKKGAKNVLIIGAATGYGLASRIISAFSGEASTLGVSFEKPSASGRTASAGWYNTAAFTEIAEKDGLYASNIMGDAFSDEIKNIAINEIKSKMGKIDLLVYSIAAPRRTDPVTGQVYNSVLKPLGSPFTSKTVDFHTGRVTGVTVEPADEAECEATVKVMGGEDYLIWIDALLEENLLAEGFKTVAYSYIGPLLTHSIYKEGTMGRAKDHLEASVAQINNKIKHLSGNAYISVNKSLVTQSSSAIPVVPLYVSIVFKIMKEKGIHEDCIRQMSRLYNDLLFAEKSLPFDECGRIRIDDLELREDVQSEVSKIWDAVNTENINEITDIKGYRDDFFELFGFGFKNVDYNAEAEPSVQIKNLIGG